MCTVLYHGMIGVRIPVVRALTFIRPPRVFYLVLYTRYLYVVPLSSWIQQNCTNEHSTIQYSLIPVELYTI